MLQLQDTLGRQFHYLRLSITDLCNFRCAYCLPNGCQSYTKNPLTLSEIKCLLKAFVELGVSKVRITGGEPTVRPDYLQIFSLLKETGVNERVLTTNGYKLDTRIESYCKSDLTGINISIDSLNPIVFSKVTGGKSLQPILSGIDSGLRLNFPNIKINAVLLKGINDGDIEQFCNFVRDKKISIRFIELMQTSTNVSYFKKHFLSSSYINQYLITRGWTLLSRNKTDGPAKVYEHPSYLGTVGVISPYSQDFCLSCNRLRVSAYGDLFLCLFGGLGYPLRHLLQHSHQKDALKANILNCLSKKLPSHLLQQGIVGARDHFSSIGG